MKVYFTYFKSLHSLNIIIKLLLFPILLKPFSIYNEPHELESSLFYLESMFLCFYLTMALFSLYFFQISSSLIHSYKYSLFICSYFKSNSNFKFQNHIFKFLLISFECLFLQILAYLHLLGFHVFMANKLLLLN